MEQLRQELQTTLEMYERACEELVHTENKVGVTSEIREVKLTFLV